ncbi:MAG: DUF6163 family protein [Alphaproteobacteria bacterium]
MTDQSGALHAPEPDRRQTPWTRRLVLFLRIMAAVSLVKGIYHWSQVLGIGDSTGSTFEQASMPWQAATVFFAVIDLVAAVGLWLAAAWGGVVWLTASISMAAIELFFPQVFGGRLWIAIPEFLAIMLYIALALMAGRERPE